MAQRGRPKGIAYVYRIFEGVTTLYVGKGTGKRLDVQKRRFKAEGEIIERLDTEEEAYKRERFWINKLMPTENKSAGGEGSFREKKAQKKSRELRVIERLGPRKAAARIVLRFVDGRNMKRFGLSIVDLIRLREIGYG